MFSFEVISPIMCVQNLSCLIYFQSQQKCPLFSGSMIWCFCCRGWKFSMATQVAMQNSGSYSIAQFQSRMIRYGNQFNQLFMFGSETNLFS